MVCQHYFAADASDTVEGGDTSNCVSNEENHVMTKNENPPAGHAL